MQKKVNLIILLILLIFSVNGYCLNLDKIKSAYLSGDYRTAISEGEKILLTSVNKRGFDELYYYMGLSYFNESNYVRATDMFNRVLNEFSNSKLKDQSRLALGDISFFQSDFTKAGEIYNKLLSNSDAKLKPAILYRLSQLATKEGNSAKNKEYLDKLRQDYPFSPEAKFSKEVKIAENKASCSTFGQKGVFSVQIGFFSSKENAFNLTEELLRKNFPAFVEDEKDGDKLSYRVKVGKYASHQEAQELENKLIQAGYPTKICP